MAFVYDPATRTAADPGTGFTFHETSVRGAEQSGDYPCGAAMTSPDYDVDYFLVEQRRDYDRVGRQADPRYPRYDYTDVWGREGAIVLVWDYVPDEVRRTPDGVDQRARQAWQIANRELLSAGLICLFSQGGTRPVPVRTDLFPPGSDPSNAIEHP